MDVFGGVASLISTIGVINLTLTLLVVALFIWSLVLAFVFLVRKTKAEKIMGMEFDQDDDVPVAPTRRTRRPRKTGK